MKNKHVLAVIVVVLLCVASFFLGANVLDRDQSLEGEVSRYNEYAPPIYRFIYSTAKDINEINEWSDVVLDGHSMELRGEGNGQLEQNSELLKRKAENLLGDTKDLNVRSREFKHISRRAEDAKQGYIDELEYYIEVADTNFTSDEDIEGAREEIEKRRKHRGSVGNEFLFYMQDVIKDYRERVEDK